MFAPMITEWRRARPIPTNAQALAMLEAAGSPPLGSEDVALADLTTRIQWSTAGYFRPGDRFAAADNAKWWNAPYAGAKVMWSHLAELADRSDSFMASDDPGRAPDIVPILDLDLMVARQDAIAQSLATMWQTLQEWRAEGKEPNPPPRSAPKKPGKEPPGGWDRWHRAAYCAVRPWTPGCMARSPIGKKLGRIDAAIMFAIAVYLLDRATRGK